MTALLFILFLISTLGFVLGLIETHQLRVQGKKKKANGWRSSWMYGLAALIFLILSLLNLFAAKKTSVPSDSTGQTQGSAPTTAVQPPTSSAPMIPYVPPSNALLTASGSGITTTSTFTASGNWDLNWNFDCSKQGYANNFQLLVYNADGTLSYANPAINKNAISAAGVQSYQTPGTYKLYVNTACAWKVNVTP